MAQRAIDPDTGQVFELKGGQWVPAAEAPAKRAAQADTAPKRESLIDNPLQGAWVGLGSVADTVARNARDLWATARGDEQAQAQIEAERQDAAEVNARLHQDAPVSSTIGRMIPGLAVGLASGGMSIPAQLAVGGAISGATSESGNIGQEAGLGALLGATGMGATNLAQRVWAGRQAMRSAGAAMREGAATMDAGTREAIDAGQRAGMAVTPGQMTGSKAMRDIEAQMAAVPGAGTVFAEIKQANEGRLRTLAARAIGVNADNVGSEVRATAERQMDAGFRKVAEEIGTVNTAPLRSTLEQMASEEALQGLPTSAALRLRGLYEKGFKGREKAAAGSGEQMSGDMLMDMRSEASSLMRQAFDRGKSTEGLIYNKAVDAIDDIVHRSALMRAGPEVADSYRTLRQQWNVLRALNNGGATIDGQIMPARTVQLIRGGDETGFFGRAVRAKEGQAAAGAGEDIAASPLASTQNRGSGRPGENPIGDFYDALRFTTSRIGQDSLPMTGARMGLAMNLSGWGNVAAVAARRFAAAPVARWYAGMSPQAAATAAAVTAAIKAPQAQAPLVDILRSGTTGAFGGSL